MATKSSNRLLPSRDSYPLSGVAGYRLVERMLKIKLRGHSPNAAKERRLIFLTQAQQAYLRRGLRHDGMNPYAMGEKTGGYRANRGNAANPAAAYHLIKHVERVGFNDNRGTHARLLEGVFDDPAIVHFVIEEAQRELTDLRPAQNLVVGQRHADAGRSTKRSEKSGRAS